MLSEKEIILHQLNLNKQKNILFKNPEAILDVNSGFISALRQCNKAETDEELVEFTAGELVRAIYRVNQFINVSTDKKEELKNIYRSSRNLISKSDNIKETLYKHHYPALSGWLSSLYPPLIREYLRDQKEIGHIICEEYSAEFQLKILRVDADSVLQPVLDIGCGRNANLVNYLRQNNIEAFGIDRLVENETGYIVNADWLTYNFNSKKWGTIISNAAFSNHVMYTAKYEKDKLKDYLLKYNEIINSLKPGGEFIYAPGLPFIEERLDRRKYKINISSITGSYWLTNVKKNVHYVF
jgi:hypothetical protein